MSENRRGVDFFDSQPRLRQLTSIHYIASRYQCATPCDVYLNRRLARRHVYSYDIWNKKPNYHWEPALCWYLYEQRDFCL